MMIFSVGPHHKILRRSNQAKLDSYGEIGYGGDDNRMQQLSRKASREDTIRDTWR